MEKSELELYIKMCDTEEIQGRVPKTGDIVAVGRQTRVRVRFDEGEVTLVFLSSSGLDEIIDKEIFLPTQEQLQEIKKKEGIADYYLINQINWFCDWINEYIYDDKDAPTDTFGSMEQLWLAYIMYTDYGMVWRDNKWVKEGISSNLLNETINSLGF